MSSQKEENTDTKSPFADNVDKFEQDVDDAYVTGIDPEKQKAKSDQVDESSMSQSEIRARKGGWVPKSEFDGDPDEWVTAKVFNERGELYDTLGKLKKSNAYLEKQVKQSTKALKALGDLNKEIGAKEYQKALETLKKEKADMLEAGEYEKVVDLDEKIAEAKQNKISAEKDDLTEGLDDDQTEELEPPTQWTDYTTDNDWYGKNRIMTKAANDLVIAYLEENGINGKPTDKQIEDCIAFMDQEVRDAFPHKFEDPGRTKSKVKPRSRTTNRTIEAGDEMNQNRTNKGKGTQSKYTVNDLTQEQLDIAKTLQKAGAFEDLQTYVDELAKVDGIVGQ